MSVIISILVKFNFANVALPKVKYHRKAEEESYTYKLCRSNHGVLAWIWTIVHMKAASSSLVGLLCQMRLLGALGETLKRAFLTLLLELFRMLHNFSHNKHQSWSRTRLLPTEVEDLQEVENWSWKFHLGRSCPKYRLINKWGARFGVHTCFIHDITESSSSNWRSEITARSLKRIAISTERHRVWSLKMTPPRFESGNGNRKSSIANTGCTAARN